MVNYTMNANAKEAYELAVKVAEKIYYMPNHSKVEQHSDARKYMLGCVATLYTLDLITGEEYSALCRDYEQKFPY